MIKNASNFHDINVIMSDGSVRTYVRQSKDFPMPRCTQSQEVVDEIDGVEITRQKFGEVYDLPPYEEGVFWIVSRLVAEAAKGRKDLLVPGPQIKGEDGVVVGCKGLSVL